jgi:hypothetical protein
MMSNYTSFLPEADQKKEWKLKDPFMGSRVKMIGKEER